MKKGEKASGQLTLSDLIARVLKSNVRNDPTGEFFWVSAMGFIGCKLSRLELSVVEYRYNIERDYEDSSVVRTAGVLNITEAKVRALEASAIERLREPDCFSYFVKNFGSKNVLIEQIQQYEKWFVIVFLNNELKKFSEDKLSHILESIETIAAIFEENFGQSSKTPTLTIADLGLSARTLTALKSPWNNITSVEELCEFGNVQHARGIGSVLAKEIKDALAKHGLKLAA